MFSLDGNCRTGTRLSPIPAEVHLSLHPRLRHVRSILRVTRHVLIRDYLEPLLKFIGRIELQVEKYELLP